MNQPAPATTGRPPSDSTPSTLEQHDQITLRGIDLTVATQFRAIRSYLPTAAKHRRSFFDTLLMLAEGQPWLPAYQ